MYVILHLRWYQKEHSGWFKDVRCSTVHSHLTDADADALLVLLTRDQNPQGKRKKEHVMEFIGVVQQDSMKLVKF